MPRNSHPKRDRRTAPRRAWRLPRARVPGHVYAATILEENAEIDAEVMRMVQEVRVNGLAGNSPVLAEMWDQMTIYHDESKADEAERRGVEVIRAEAYL
jgi:hypothetical protein